MAQIFSLVVPTGWGLALGVFAAAMIAVWLNRRSILEDLARWMAEIRKAPVGIILLFAAVAAVVIYKGSDIPFNYDTGLYHAQAIQWIETAPAVKGLGNFSDRLAFDSAWLVFAAFASGSWLVPGGFHAPGILLFVPIVIEGGWRLARLLRGEFRVSHVLAVIFLVAGRRLFSLEFSSPGTDMPATLLVWLAFLYSLDLVENHESGNSDRKALGDIDYQPAGGDHKIIRTAGFNPANLLFSSRRPEKTSAPVGGCADRSGPAGCSLVGAQPDPVWLPGLPAAANRSV